jgi:hypothetical protein
VSRDFSSGPVGEQTPKLGLLFAAYPSLVRGIIEFIGQIFPANRKEKWGRPSLAKKKVLPTKKATRRPPSVLVFLVFQQKPSFNRRVSTAEFQPISGKLT